MNQLLINNITKFIKSAIIILIIISLGFCEQDPDPAERELFTYLTVCTSSTSQCQANCSISSDQSSNGIIEGYEEQLYNTCISNCQSACAQVFLFYLLTDEGN